MEMHGYDAYRLRFTLPQSPIPVALIILSFLALALAAPLEPPLDLDAFRNLTATNRCADSPDWQAYAFLVEDCFTAIQRVYIEEVLNKRPDEVYEFVAPSSSPRTMNPWVRTPSQYIVSQYHPPFSAP